MTPTAASAVVDLTPAPAGLADGHDGREDPMFEAIGGRVSRVSRRAVLGLVVLSLAGCSGTPSGARVDAGGASASTAIAAPKPGGGGGALGVPVTAGGDLCKLLGPGDFAAAGVPDASGPTENPSDPLDNFCVYRGQSSATGGIEMDVSVSDTAADAHGVFPEMFGEYPAANVKSVTVAGADEALLNLPTFEGSTDPALIGVRKGKLTIGIGFGTTYANAQQAAQQLQALAALALQRGAALGG